MKYPLLRFLYRIKAYHPKAWLLIENINSRLFGIFYFKRLTAKLQMTMSELSSSGCRFRMLTLNDLSALKELLNSLEPGLQSYFEPHSFSEKALIRQMTNKAFFMMGAFQGKQLIGYFFIRAGVNKKCFVGRLVHKNYRRKGIGHMMNKIMYDAAWQAGFRIFATFSMDNTFVIESHKNNPFIIYQNPLENNYILVEFKRHDLSSENNHNHAEGEVPGA